MTGEAIRLKFGSPVEGHDDTSTTAVALEIEMMSIGALQFLQ
jgi:hypothetical protein